MLALLMACATTIPPQIAQTVSRNLSFAEVRRDPDAYVGRTIAVGGVVTGIDAVVGGYRIAVREFPLDGGGRQRPAVEQPSGGTFLVRVANGALPRGLRPGVEVTVVGEILGRSLWSEAERDVVVPLLDQRYMHVWGLSWWPRLQIGISGSIGI